MGIPSFWSISGLSLNDTMKNDVECSFIFRFSKKFSDKVEKPHVFFFGLVTEKSAFTGPKAAALTGENNIFKNYSQRS